ncbi:MAG: hypothetical protein ACTSYT_04155 [Candidatus Asgardarchaeia archaeon]
MKYSKYSTENTLLLLKPILNVLSIRMSDREKLILRCVVESQGKDSLTSFALKVSKSLGLPLSTVKRILKFLRETGMIEAGSAENPGIPIKASVSAILLVEFLRGEPS